MKKSRNRSGQVVMLVFLFMMVILAINVCYLCTTGKTMISNVNVRDFAKNRGGGQVTKVVQAARGTIYTSDNEIVASDVKKYKLRAILAKRLDAKKNPQYVVDKDQTAKELAPILGVSKATILDRLNQNTYQVEFGNYGRNLSSITKEKIMALKEKNQMQILQPEQESRQKEALDIELKGNVHQEEIADIYARVLYNSKKIQGKKLFDYNIVLIGFMGAGKSTISDFLRTVFAMEVVEMDQIIAEREGMSISDIFETYGEEYFRNLETELLIEMQSKTNVVISCGGGVPMRERNVVEMKKNGRVVLLTAKPETILSRVKDNHDRPLLEGNKNVDFIAGLMEKRREKYQAAADIVIETDGKDKLEICEELVQRIRALDAEE